jgi:hypothetical protein
MAEWEIAKWCFWLGVGLLGAVALAAGQLPLGIVAMAGGMLGLGWMGRQRSPRVRPPRSAPPAVRRPKRRKAA